MTKSQLESVIDALVEIVDGWNDAAADDERGRANDAICLSLWDDGSGTLGRRAAWSINEVEDWHEFDNIDELLRVLLDGEGVELEKENT